jgi:hypothetical protein
MDNNNDNQQVKAGTILMPPDEADLCVLFPGKESRKIGFPVGVPLPYQLQEALERAQDSEWILLIDIVPAANVQLMMRIWRLTDAGVARLKQVETRAFLTRGSREPLMMQGA